MIDFHARYHAIYAELQAMYGTPVWRPTLPVVDELVNTILSQATSDLNRDKGFAGLQAAFPRSDSSPLPDWEAVMNAPEAAVRDAILSAGLANQKAPRIQGALRHIYRERGAIELDFLADLPLAEARAWLTAIAGIGPKTAAIILLFALGRPAFPVDTHVHRITRRLGLIGPKVSANKAHDVLEDLVPADHFYPLHMNLITHGRTLCRARAPLCAGCRLRPLCADYQARVGK